MDLDLFLKTFKKHCIDIDNIRVERACNIPKKPETAKKIIVNDYLKKGNFKRVRLFDDHVGNLKSFMKLKDKFPEVDFILADMCYFFFIEIKLVFNYCHNFYS